MIIQIAVGVIALCIVVKPQSMREGEKRGGGEDFFLRIETDIRPILYDMKEVINDLKGMAETAKQGTRRVNNAIEILLGPIETLGILMKAIRVGIETFLKRRGGEGHGL